METDSTISNKASPDTLPPLFHYIKSNSVAGFDSVEYCSGKNLLDQSNSTTPIIPPPELMLTKDTEAPSSKKNAASLPACSPNSSVQAFDFHGPHSISISMPSSPAGFSFDQCNRIFFDEASGETPDQSGNPSIPNKSQPKKVKFLSQPMPAAAAHAKEISFPMDRTYYNQNWNSRADRLKDKRYDSFKTWSGKLERQLSNLRGRPQETEPEVNDSQNLEVKALPVDRFFDALEGPELDTLRPSEELVLPKDKWPFLLRFPVSSFGICLGIGSQAILWKTLATSPSLRYLHVTPVINIVLWCIAIAVTAIVMLIYFLKIVFYFEAVRREYYHPIRVNFFFAPWIALLFLALGVPPPVAKNLHSALWYVLMGPILSLELKIYGQWMSGGQRRLSKVANPSNHLSIVGNFVGALLGASMGLKEGPIFFFSVGLAHYIVLFVTLYQRLPTNETLPKELHPVFFLFVAAPSVASMAWAKIQGDFDFGSRIAYFIALFLYFSLAVRVNFFRGFRFSLAWWAYTFPMTGAAIATIKYSNEVNNLLTEVLSIILSAISTLTVTALLVSTVVHAFVLRDLFPNDIAIAIADQKPKGDHKRIHLQSEASKDTEMALDIDVNKD